MTSKPFRTARRLPGPGLIALLLLAMGINIAATAAARPDPAPADADAATPQEPEVSVTGAFEDEEEHVRRMAGMRLARLALLYLRELTDPMPADYRLAAIVLDEASELAPDSAEIVRRAVEAWHAAGDDEAVLRATERLILLDPDDTVSQLRLISASIRKRHQHAEARLAVYDRLLGPAGSKLDNSIRSRLALDDALISRELGDDERFLRRLTEATQLDSTNKGAASLAASYYLSRTRDPLGRVEILTNLILSDPHDPSAHEALKQEFMRHGAYWGAMRFSRRVADLHYLQESEPSREHGVEELVIRWGLEGPRRLLEHLEIEEESARVELARLRRAYVEAELDPDDIPPYSPDPVRQRIRLIASLSISAGEHAEKAIPHVVRGAEETIRQYIQISEENPEHLQQAIDVTRRIQSELLWLHLWTGANPERARSIYADIREHVPESERKLYDAFISIENEEYEEARTLLRDLVDTDPRARIGLGLIAEHRQNRDEAVRQYARIALDHPGAPPHPGIPYGLWSHSRIQFLLGEPLRTPEVATKLNEYASRLPRAIEAIVSSPHNFMHLSVEHLHDTATPLDPMELRVRLRNLSNIPLPLGPQSAMNTSLLLIPRVLVEGQLVSDQIKPEVASINRRIRLRPGETLDTIVWAGQGETGAIVDQIVSNTASVRWRAMQNFRVDQETGRYKTGAFAVSAESNRQVRPRIHHVTDRPEKVIESIEVARGRILLETLMRARYVLFSADRLSREPGDAEAIRTAIADAVAARYDTMSPEERVFTLLALPASWIFEECEAIDAKARLDADRRVVAAYLLSRLVSRNDEVFARINASDDEVLHQLASLTRRRLGGGPRSVTPQLDPEQTQSPAEQP